VIRAVQILTGQLVKEIKQVYLVYAAAGAFVLYLISLINIFASWSASYNDSASAAECNILSGALKQQCLAAVDATSYSVGAGFGIWASLILSIALVYFVALSAQKTEKLPFAIPGPKL
jgi:hypothetical protein